MTAERLRLRAVAGLGMPLVAFALLLFRLGEIQLQDHDEWLQSARRQQWTGVLAIPARRGDVLDRNGRALARSEQRPSVAIDPRYARERREVGPLLRLLREHIGVDARETLQRVSPRCQFVWIARRLADRDAVDRLLTAARAESVKSLIVQHEPERVYPAGATAAQVLGFVHRNGEGAEGVERVANARLRGLPGRRRTERDGKRRRIVLAGQPAEQPAPGADVHVTLDAVVQQFTEEAADEAYTNHTPESVVAAVADVRTGEILGLACRPTFDPNDPAGADAAARRNRFFTDTFEPGSTFKPLVMAMALECGAVSPGERIDECEDGLLQVGKRTIHEDRRKALGVLTPTGVLAYSSNVGMAVVGLRMGVARLETGVRLWGFGARTGVGWPAEARGTVRARSEWSEEWTLCSVAFGHEMTATPAQLLMAYGALANGGLLNAPRLLLDAPVEPPVRVLQPATAQRVTRMLEEVMLRGTARHVATPDYRVAGKTGTAQKLGRGNEGKHTSSFACYGPAEAPRLAVLVVSDEPRGSQYGSVVAAPYAARLLRRSLRYLSVPPSAREPAPIATTEEVRPR